MNDTTSYCEWTEAERLAALDRYQILDTPPEKAFDDVVKLASELVGAPFVAINLIAQGRQWFKSEIGLGVREMPLDDSICKIAIFEQDRMIVPDTLEDARFNCNPLVTGPPSLRFYAGELLKTPDGLPLGTLCVLDSEPRPEGLTPQQQFVLRTLAQQIVAQLELRKLVFEQNALLLQHRRTEEELRLERDRSFHLLQGMDEGFVFLDCDYRIQQISPGGLRMDGRTEAELVGMTHWDAWLGSEQLPVAEAIKRAMTQRVAADLVQSYVFPDGRKFWFDVRIYPAEGGIALFYRNISERKEADERLRQTAQRLEFTLESAKIGDWDLDLINDKSHRSMRHDACFGYTQPISDWGFEAFLQHVHADDREEVAKQFEAALAELKDWHFECRVVWPDETIHWIAAHGSVYHVDSKPTRMTGIVYDITERKQTEKALRESERHAMEAAALAESERRRLNALLEAAPVGIGYADVHGRLLVVNSENRRIWGKHPLSDKVDEYLEWKGWWADGSEKQGERIEAHQWGLARALRGEDVLRDIIEIEPFGMPGVRRTVLLRATPIRDVGEEITGAAVAQMDITDRVQAEKALRKSEAHLRALLEQSAAGICETDLTGRIVRVNDHFCEIVARTREELLTLRMQDITHPDDLPRNLPLFERTIATGEPFEIQKRYIRPDGGSIWVSNTVSLIRMSGEEAVSSILAVSIDVSERKLAEEALKQADQRKDEFLAMLAHELRNPLAPISAAAQLLRLAADNPARSRQASEIIARQVKHMTELVDDLLDVSRVTRGLVELNRENLDLKSIVASAIEQARPLIEARHHVLVTRMDAEQVIVHGDRTRLIQVLTNLLGNSAKYTTQGGEINLRVGLQGKQVKIEVEDNGIGIDAKLLPYIFELFTQAERTPDRAQGGLGIGLALVKSIVALHGGTIQAYSNGSGAGSIFTVSLPLAHQQQLEKDAKSEQAAVVGKPLTILVVDDNVDAAQTLASLLELHGHRVTVAENATAALEQAKHQHYEGFILDIGLPDMTGYGLARKIRERDSATPAVFIALTGYGQQHDRVLSKVAGFDYHFVKPIDMGQLAEALATVG